MRERQKLSLIASEIWDSYFCEGLPFLGCGGIFSEINFINLNYDKSTSTRLVVVFNRGEVQNVHIFSKHIYICYLMTVSYKFS